MSSPMTLTVRLLAVVVLLVALTAGLIAVATTVVMRANLLGDLDEKVASTLDRFASDDRDRPGGLRVGRFESAGTLLAVHVEDHADRAGAEDRDSDDGGSGGSLADQGIVLGEGSEWGSTVRLDAEQLAAVREATDAGGPVTVRVPELGRYRLLATTRGNSTAVAGLPQADVDRTVGNLVQLEVLATLFGVALAGGAGAVVVRRQLAPLREVAATAHRASNLQLSSGTIVLDERVPAHLTDTRTEVGQVGAALNALLAHVETSLGAREASERQVRQFVADASHELRTPLATIAGYTELAQRQPGAVEQALARVGSESARMATLVEDLLLLARLDAGRPLASAPVDLSQLLVETVGDTRVLGGDHHWRLELPPTPVVVAGDRDRLHQVAVNLLTNARLHTPADTTVTATVHPDGFSVHDDGPGFTADLLPHAFDRFSRGDESRTRSTEATGTGLGLSVVRAIVDAHGGRVGLTSGPTGTTVRVWLPGTLPGAEVLSQRPDDAP